VVGQDSVRNDNGEIIEIKDADALMKQLGKEKFIRTLDRRFKELGYGIT
jgi:hypothetical protein